MIQKLTTVAIISGALLLAACNTVRGAGSDVQSAANCTENAINGGNANPLTRIERANRPAGPDGPSGAFSFPVDRAAARRRVGHRRKRKAAALPGDGLPA